MPHYLISNTLLGLSTAKLETPEDVKAVKDSLSWLAGYCDNNYKPLGVEPSDFFGLAPEEIASFIEKHR